MVVVVVDKEKGKRKREKEKRRAQSLPSAQCAVRRMVKKEQRRRVSGRERETERDRAV